MLERRSLQQPVAQNNRSSGRDRRTSPRYPAGGTIAILSWSDGEDYRTVAARLSDISLGGGSALAETAPPEKSPVWFRLRGDDASPWVGATVISVCRTGMLGRGPRFIRWRFSEACPYQIFKEAIDGFSEEVHDQDYTRRNTTRSEWR